MARKSISGNESHNQNVLSGIAMTVMMAKSNGERNRVEAK
jgi:hypothetical protein